MALKDSTVTGTETVKVPLQIELKGPTANGTKKTVQKVPH